MQLISCTGVLVALASKQSLRKHSTHMTERMKKVFTVIKIISQMTKCIKAEGSHILEHVSSPSSVPTLTQLVFNLRLYGCLSWTV